MATALNLFPARVRIADENGYASPEFLRALQALFIRVGGATAPTITELASAQRTPVLFDDGGAGEPGPMGPPGRDGAEGAMGLSIPGADGDDGESAFAFLLPAPYRTASTPARAVNTTYTNVSVSTLLVHLTLRCVATLGAGQAYAQALMDTATPPTTPASGLVGIQTGLLGEDNTYQLVFLVNPGGTYRVNTTAVNGTVTLGTWFEFSI